MPKYKKYTKTDYPVECDTCGLAMEPELYSCPVHGGEFLEDEDSPCPVFCGYTPIVVRYSPLCDCMDRYESAGPTAYAKNPNIKQFTIKTRDAECDCDVCTYPLYKGDFAYLVDNTDVCCSKICAWKITPPKFTRGFDGL